jgi:hypothetical protein
MKSPMGAAVPQAASSSRPSSVIPSGVRAAAKRGVSLVERFAGGGVRAASCAWASADCRASAARRIRVVAAM